MGIGLTLVKRLVEMHGGDVIARSEGLDQGSEFIVSLPVFMPPKQELNQSPIEMDQGFVESRRRILVADDNRDSATSMALILELMGFNAEIANDGLQALEIGKDFQPEVILLDIGMPKLNGYATCQRMRQTAWGRNAILIAVTGWGQDEDRRLSEKAGFDRHLVKPIDPAVLASLLSSKN